eukprot:COSAG01_NODE_789_length_13572_cov_322.875158_1_plen_158_part_10
MAIRHAGDHIAPTYRFVLSLLGGIRRWTFLPTLVVTVYLLVWYKGGDALSVCFNTVAVLFLCEIDNLLYAIVLPERERARVEVEGRVELGESEAVVLMRSKAVHVVLVVVVVPCAVLVAPGVVWWAGGGGSDSSCSGWRVSPKLCWVAQALGRRARRS